jgi:hypothetical protein
VINGPVVPGVRVRGGRPRGKKHTDRGRQALRPAGEVPTHGVLLSRRSNAVIPGTAILVRLALWPTC